MKTYRKKIALILVLALTLAVAIPALAAQKTEITGEYVEQVMEVKIPLKAKLIINPTGLPVSIKADDETTEIAKLEKPGQIVTPTPLVGCNLSAFDLSIGATVTGTTKGAFKLASSVPSASDTSKSGLIFLQLSNPKDASGNDYDLNFDTTGVAAKDTTISGCNATEVMKAVNGWTEVTYNAKDAADKLIVGKTAATKRNMCTVKAAEDGIPGGGSYFMARLTGNVVMVPKEEWVTADGVDVSITWVIEPAAAKTN